MKSINQRSSSLKIKQKKIKEKKIIECQWTNKKKESTLTPSSEIKKKQGTSSQK